MARISKPGLDYFPLDVNFFQDRKVRRISNRHHAAGIAALTFLLCLIYKEKGFYVAWNQDTLFDISQEVCCEEEEMQAIIDDCLSVGLFDTYIYKEYGILTSQAIQEQYHKIITDSRRKYKLPLEQFWLIKEGEDGTENNSAEIRNNINSKGTEVDEAESHIVGAEVNAIKTGINITATEVTKTKTGIGTTGTNIHAAGTGINATKTVTDEAAMKINAAKKREIAATIPQTKQETDTEIESKSETDTEIKSKPERERERDKERERQSKTENEWEKDREQPPVPSNGVFQAAPVAVKGLSLEISSGKRGEENKEERRNEGIDQKGETRYNGIQYERSQQEEAKHNGTQYERKQQEEAKYNGTQYERNQQEEAKHNGTQYERNQQEEAKHNGTQYERNQQEEAPNESTASGGFSESLLRLNMDAIGIRNEPTVKAILALARRRKLGGPCGTLWKVLSSEYRSTLLKKNEPGDYILWALNHSAEFEDTYNGILKKRVRGR
ncbi:bacteriophage-related replication protein [Bacteroides thetaiotaomicron]|uniref:Bacteriophage-related replication protein n=1 Tax=Bacteroides thetaiotaomicron TaxID=818 RepID=A0A174V2S7_BACT4|nr:DUF4373 domain-containing protein [Bacteroides thetaiotaomicron]CUQ26335.1 bacteriophage-related replication protein [Bacteroides thetaiotaomicron]